MEYTWKEEKSSTIPSKGPKNVSKSPDSGVVLVLFHTLLSPMRHLKHKLTKPFL